MSDWKIKQSFLSTFSKRNTANWKKKEKEKGIKRDSKINIC